MPPQSGCSRAEVFSRRWTRTDLGKLFFLSQVLDTRSFVAKIDALVNPPAVAQTELVRYKTMEALASALRNDLDADRRLHDEMILPSYLNLPVASAGVYNEVSRKNSLKFVSQDILDWILTHMYWLTRNLWTDCNLCCNRPLPTKYLPRQLEWSWLWGSCRSTLSGIMPQKLATWLIQSQCMHESKEVLGTICYLLGATDTACSNLRKGPQF